MDFTLHALQETGRLNVLSRPYVLTRNNQTATIRVAEEVPIPSSTSQANGQSQHDQLHLPQRHRYRAGGHAVHQPRGAGQYDGHSEDHDANGRDGPDLGGSQPEVFATRSASTRVAVLDGQTIVIGGLIEDQVNETVKKVPLLGDIPHRRDAVPADR